VLPAELIVPSLVLPAVDYLAATRLGATAARAFQRAVVRGDFQIVDNTAADDIRALEVREQYSDLTLGLVDSSILAITRATHFHV
jgi:predicted nucleic acid-binding protein